MRKDLKLGPPTADSQCKNNIEVDRSVVGQMHQEPTPVTVRRLAYVLIQDHNGPTGRGDATHACINHNGEPSIVKYHLTDFNIKIETFLQANEVAVTGYREGWEKSTEILQNIENRDRGAPQPIHRVLSLAAAQLQICLEAEQAVLITGINGNLNNDCMIAWKTTNLTNNDKIAIKDWFQQTCDDTMRPYAMIEIVDEDVYNVPQPLACPLRLYVLQLREKFPQEWLDGLDDPHTQVQVQWDDNLLEQLVISDETN